MPIQTSHGTYVTTKKAIFLLLSDFGAEGFSARHSNEELLQYVIQDIQDVWGNHLYKQCQLQDNIVPFVPLELPSTTDTARMTIETTGVPQPVRDLIKASLSSVLQRKGVTMLAEKNRFVLDDLKCDEKCVDFISRMLYYQVVTSINSYRLRNYRGVEQLFMNRVLQPIVAKIRSVYDCRITVSLEVPSSASSDIVVKVTRQRL